MIFFSCMIRRRLLVLCYCAVGIILTVAFFSLGIHQMYKKKKEKTTKREYAYCVKIEVEAKLELTFVYIRPTMSDKS